MALYVTRKCPNCRFVLERARDYIAIGDSIVTCPNCSQKIILEHINEWEDLSLWWKIRYILTELYTCFLWGLGVVIVLYGVTEYLFKNLFQDAFFLILALVGLFATYVIRIYLFIKEIKESKERTAKIREKV